MPKKQSNSTLHIKIYEKSFGKRPKDSNGRSFHIHHKDGNHLNNDLSNLIALSPEDHYKIHLQQGDISAALYLSQFLNLSADEISDLARQSANNRVKNGTHNFLGDNNPAKRKSKDGTHHWFGPEHNRRRVENGTHHWLGPEQNQKRIQAGTHNLLGDKNPNHRRIKDGTHNFLGPYLNETRIKDGTHNFLGDKNPNHKRIKDGTHNFNKEFTKKLIETGKHINAKIFECPYCQKIGKGPVMKRHHFDKCKFRTQDN